MNNTWICNKKAWWVFGDNAKKEYRQWVGEEINEDLESVNNVFTTSKMDVDPEINEKILGYMARDLDKKNNNITVDLSHDKKSLTISFEEKNPTTNATVQKEIKAKCNDGYIVKVTKSSNDVADILTEIDEIVYDIKEKAVDAVKKKGEKDEDKREEEEKDNEYIKRTQSERKEHWDETHGSEKGPGDDAFRQFG